MTMTANTLRRSTAPEVDGFDRMLGASSRRYLGGGHTRVSIYVTGVIRLDEDTFGGSATVIYPEDWSVKEGQQRTPHLSTVDAIRIADITHGKLRETHLPWLSCYAASSLEVRAGAKPCEVLEELAVASRLEGTSRDDTVIVRHKIGTLLVSVTWTRQSNVLSREVVSADHDGAVVHAVQLEGADTATCRIHRRATGSAEMSFVEALTLTAQLAQVVLYGGDAAVRERSRNMWMRRARFERIATSEATAQTVVVQLHNQRELSVGGDTIRTVDVLAEDVCGIKVTASLAMPA